jgi:epoxide hydrolase-like predicted phosphatase
MHLLPPFVTREKHMRAHNRIARQKRRAKKTSPDVRQQTTSAPAMMTADRLPTARDNVDLLVFDMGHVFIDFEWEAVCLGFCAQAGCSLDQLRAVFKEVAQLGYESGRIDTHSFLAELNQRLQSQITREQFTEIWTTSFRENEHMAELLQKLKLQRPLYLLSNTNEVHYEWLQSRYNVARHFQELILSYKVGCSKPEAQIYHEVLNRSGIAPDRCLFIDDLECNINAAAGLGMQTILFRGVDDLKTNLTGLGFTI